jgi:hypothetical protein
MKTKQNKKIKKGKRVPLNVLNFQK